MALDIEITGAALLKQVAAHIQAEGNKGLGREMSAALKRASDPVQRSIRTEYQGLPSGGGYAATFSKSLRFRTATKTAARSASFRLLTFADGTKQRRDIKRLEDGQLRHPVWGRSRVGSRKGERIANPWAVTRVRGNFHKRGTDHAIDDAEKEMTKVLADFSARLIT